MELKVPDWVCSDFFAQCLQIEKGNPNLVVTNIVTSPAAPPGNNYGSFIVRVKVEYKNSKDDTVSHTISLILKSDLTEGAFKDMIEDLPSTEPTFYHEFLPKARKYTNASFVPHNLFSPKPNAVILQDLKDLGFVMADRTKQLDFDHCRLYIVAAASFHAVSFAVHKDDPELVESDGKSSMYSNEVKGCEISKLMINGGMPCLVDAVDKMENYKKYSKLIRDTAPVLWDMLVDIHKLNREMVNTLVQGDPWITNMMFKYDSNGIVREVKLLDFQILNYGSPVHDVLTFIWGSSNIDVKLNRLDELYRIYVDTFNNKLKEFRCTEHLDYQQFKDDVKKFSPLALQVVGVVIPLVTDPSPLDFTAMMSKENEPKTFFQRYYSEDFCSKQLPQLMEALEQSGVFEYLNMYK